MTKRMRWSLALPTLLLAVVLPACEQAAEPLGPELARPETQVEAQPNLVASSARPVSARAAYVQQVLSWWEQWQDCRFGFATAGQGDVVEIAELGMRLDIPRGAVAQATWFAMCPRKDGTIGADLYATAIGRTSGLNDVGSKGFAVPVRLTLSYASAEAVNEATVLVAYDRRDGTYEAQPSLRDPLTKRVTGLLRHFSGYIVAD